VTREEVERAFADAGWELDNTFCTSESVVGSCGELMILAYESEIRSEDPLFELVDFKQVVTHWVGVLPTPRIASALLRQYGEAPGEESGNPYLRD
jgi:hypothetical protein